MTGRNRWKGSFRPIHGRAVAATGRRSWRLSAHHRLVLLPRCSSTDESQFVAVHPPSPPSRSPRSPPAAGWTTMPSTLENQGTSMPW